MIKSKTPEKKLSSENIMNKKNLTSLKRRIILYFTLEDSIVKLTVNRRIQA
jgi:hypothetical protein